jgi:hypothetical protein
MLRKWRTYLAVLVVMACALAPAQAQVAVVTLRSVDSLRSDIRYLLTLAGQENRAKQLDGLIAALTQGKGFFGIDTKRPIGLATTLPDKPGEPPRAIAFIPITKEEEFLDFLRGVNLEPSKPKGGIYGVDLPTGQTLYLRFANQHAFASDSDANLAKVPDPATLIPATHKDRLLAATIRLDQIPKEYKQMFLAEMDRELENEKEKKPGESDAEHQARVASIKMVRQAIGELIDESRDLHLNLQVEQQNNRISIDLSLSGQPGSPLAANFKNFGTGRSMFSGLAQNSALNFLLHAPVPAEIRKEQAKLYDQVAQQALKDIPDAKQRAIAEKVLKAIEPTLLKSEVIDVGAVLRGPMADGRYVIIAGLKVQEGQKIEQMIRDVIKEIPPRERDRIKLDNQRIAGTSVHLIQPEQADEHAKKLFGNTDIHLAIRPEVVLVTVGQHGPAAMKEALDQLGKPAASDAAPIQIEVSLSKILPLSPENREQLMEAAKKAFAGADKDHDKVRLSLQGGETLRLRLEADAAILKLAAALSPFGN